MATLVWQPHRGQAECRQQFPTSERLSNYFRHKVDWADRDSAHAEHAVSTVDMEFVSPDQSLGYQVNFRLHYFI